MEFNKIYCCDVLEGLKQLPDESVDCIITSPPYWGLRCYGESTIVVRDGKKDCEHEWIENERQNISGGMAKGNEIVGATAAGVQKFKIKEGFCSKCSAWRGQLGLEPSLDLFIKHLLQVTAELKRVLKKSGVLFWNHGDCYGGTGTGHKAEHFPEGHKLHFKGTTPASWYADIEKKGVTAKCLALQNYRLIIKMIEQGWILRNTIIWHKPNSMPSSVKDRFSNTYEPVFMLTKSKKYWFDLDAVRVPHKTESNLSRPRMGQGSRTIYSQKRRTKIPKEQAESMGSPRARYHRNYKYSEKEAEPEGHTSIKQRMAFRRRVLGLDHDACLNHPAGKNPGDLWTISTQPFKGAHFAVFPEALVKPMILAGCPREVCRVCGHVRTRITEKKLIVHKKFKDKGKALRNVESGSKEMPAIPRVRTGLEGHNEFTTVGWTDCEHKDYSPGVVLDPFSGAGTTLKVARDLNRRFIGFELNPDYVKLIERRIKGYKDMPSNKRVYDMLKVDSKKSEKLKEFL